MRRPSRCPSVPIRRAAAWLSLGSVLALQAIGPYEYLRVAPYLRHVTATEVTVAFEMIESRAARVRFGVGDRRDRVIEDAPACLHTVRLTGLAPGQVHTYVVSWQQGDGWRDLPPRPFVTAPLDDRPFTFAVVGDTQDQPEIWQQVAAQVEAARPAFVVHVGDLVGQGCDAQAWWREFFRPARLLLATVPILPVPGNHEEDGPPWYRYMAPDGGGPCWRSRYGGVEFFGIDSNHPCGRGSVQYEWLAHALSDSTARWRIVMHHHPVYSSDADDYGDTGDGVAASGDPRVQDLAALYEAAGVDLVLSGHVHGYERTWPLRAGVVDRQRGVTYVVTGGAGGYLDRFSAVPSWFSATVRPVHHHLLVFVEGDRLTLRAHDMTGHWLDEVVLGPRLPERVVAAAGP